MVIYVSPYRRAHGAEVFSVASEGECAFVTQLTATRIRQGAARCLVAQWRACAVPASAAHHYSVVCFILNHIHIYCLALITNKVNS